MKTCSECKYYDGEDRCYCPILIETKKMEQDPVSGHFRHYNLHSDRIWEAHFIEGGSMRHVSAKRQNLLGKCVHHEVRPPDRVTPIITACLVLAIVIVGVLVVVQGA